MRSFSIRVVLSVLTGRLLLTSEGCSQINDFVFFLESEGDGKRTAAKKARFKAQLCAELVRQQPALAGIADTFNEGDWYGWVVRQEATLGKQMSFHPMKTHYV